MATEASHRNLYLAASISCLTGALFGYSVGFIGGVVVLPAFLHQFGLDELSPEGLASATSGTITSWIVGALFGVPLAMPICSRFGRKMCLSFAAALYVLGAIMQLINLGDGRGLVAFDIGRLLNGLGVGAGTLVSPLYLAEISPPTQRGMVLSGFQVAVQFAALIGFWAAFAAHAALSDSSSLQWQIPVAVQLLPGILLLLGTFFVAESPTYLAEKGRLPDAGLALSWLRRLPVEHVDVQTELETLRSSSRATKILQSRNQSFWKQALEKSVRKRLIVGNGLMVAQNMVGLNALNFYAPAIFWSAGFTSVSMSLFLTGLFGVTKLISSLSYMFVFVHIRGNRFWLKIGSLVCGASMLILAICIQRLSAAGNNASVSEDTASFTGYGIVAVLMVNIFALAFGWSLGPISWNVCSEIFPTQIKAQCCAITTCTQWLFQIVIASTTPILLNSFGWATYVFYAVCCLVSFIWVVLYVPETQGVPLGTPMDELFGTSPEDAVRSQSMDEVSETTALLRQSNSLRTRRDSIGFSV